MALVETLQSDQHISYEGYSPEFPPDPRVAMLQSESEGHAAELAKEAAFADIVDEFQGKLTGFVANIAGAHRAEDVVQETFFSAFKAMDRFKTNSENALSNWLYSIARNRALNETRGNKHLDLFDHPGTDGVLPATIANAPSRIGDPVTQLEFKETLSVLDRLSPIHRSVLLQSADGRSQEDMAEAEGISVGAVKGRIVRGRRAANRMLSELDELPEVDENSHAVYEPV